MFLRLSLLLSTTVLNDIYIYILKICYNMATRGLTNIYA